MAQPQAYQANHVMKDTSADHPPRTPTPSWPEHQPPPGTKAQPIDRTGHAAPPAEEAPPRPADCIPRISPQPLGCVPTARSARTPPTHPRVRQGCHPRTCQVLCCRVLRVRPRRSAGAARQAALPCPLRRSPRGYTPAPLRTQSFWRNVGPTLGGIRRLTEVLSKVP